MDGTQQALIHRISYSPSLNTTTQLACDRWRLNLLRIRQPRTYPPLKPIQIITSLSYSHQRDIELVLARDSLATTLLPAHEHRKAEFERTLTHMVATQKRSLKPLRPQYERSASQQSV